MTISLCMIVKNEEDTLGNCLSSVAGIFDEINIIDTGSTDRTVEIAQKYTDRIFYFDWIYDFSAARNFSFSKATMEYIMWLDADDILLEENRKKLLNLKKTLPKDIDYVVTPYNCTHDEQGNPLYVIKRERIVKRARNFKWTETIHESLDVSGKSFYADIAIKHNHIKDEELHEIKMARNFEVLNIKKESGKPFSTRDMYYYARSLHELDRHEESIVWFKNLIDALPAGERPQVDAYTLLHKSYVALGQYESALMCLLGVEASYSGRAEFYCCLGEFFKDTVKDYETAIKYYKKALNCKITNDMTSINMDFYYNIPYSMLAGCYLGSGDYENAILNYKAALKFSPYDEDVKALVLKLEKLVSILNK